MTGLVTTPATTYGSTSIMSEQDDFEDVSMQGIPSKAELNSIVKDAFLSTKDPHKSGIKTFILNLIAYLTDTFGEKMSSSELNVSISNVFNKKDGWEKLTTNENATGHDFFKKKYDGSTFIVSSVCHDLQQNDDTVEQMKAGNNPAAQTLKHIIEDNPTGYIRISIPIAQSGSYVFGQRGHFTLLDVAVDNGKIDSAILIDSKNGLLDSLYDGAEHLNKQIKDCFGDNSDAFKKVDDSGIATKVKVEVEYKSDQSLFNGSDCGRYSLYYANEVAKQGTHLLNNTSTEKAKEFFNRYANDNPATESKT